MALISLIFLLFVAPYYRLTVSKTSGLFALLVFLVGALVAGQQTWTLRKREQLAIQRQAELELLNALASRVSSSTSADQIARFTVGSLAELLSADRVALYVSLERARAPRILAQAKHGQPRPDEAAAVTAALREGQTRGLPSSDGGVAPMAIIPLAVRATSAEGALIAVATARRWSDDDERLLLSVANLASAALERLRLLDEAARVDALAEADRLKTTFVSSISHELKTPLAAATARVTGLLEEDGSADELRVRDELTAIAEELKRLDASIGDLLLLSRLESDSWRPHLEPQELSEVVAIVFDRLSERERDRVRFQLEERLPLVAMDLAQVARAFANLVGNALLYSRHVEPIVVGAGRRGSAVELWVEDHGPGVGEGEKPLLFDKFYRGSAAATVAGGTGLGLSIASEIAEAHRGHVELEDVEPTGARFSIVLPALEGPQ